MSWMGVAGLPEEAVPADADGAVNGDPHGVDLGEGISQVLRIHSAHCSEWLHQESVSESLCPSRSVPPGLLSLGTLDQEANPWSWSHNCETSWVTIVGAGRTGRKLRVLRNDACRPVTGGNAIARLIEKSSIACSATPRRAWSFGGTWLEEGRFWLVKRGNCSSEGPSRSMIDA